MYKGIKAGALALFVGVVFVIMDYFFPPGDIRQLYFGVGLGVFAIFLYFTPEAWEWYKKRKQEKQDIQDLREENAALKIFLRFFREQLDWEEKEGG